MDIRRFGAQYRSRAFTLARSYENYATYYELGLMQLNVLGLRRQAAASFRRALALNPYDDNSSYELSAALAPAATP